MLLWSVLRGGSGRFLRGTRGPARLCWSIQGSHEAPHRATRAESSCEERHSCEVIGNSMKTWNGERGSRIPTQEQRWGLERIGDLSPIPVASSNGHSESGSLGSAYCSGRRIHECSFSLRQCTAEQGTPFQSRGMSTATKHGEGSFSSDPEATEGAARGSGDADVAPGADVAVDVSGLRRSGHVHTREEEEGLSPMEKQLLSLIRFRGGPISVAEFMEQVLTNPVSGYYMQPNVFGTEGDFVTSPDISQMFGELGRPSRLQLVELGPGRGALMADLLRGTWKFADFRNALSGVALVEVSPALRNAQRAALSSSAARTRAAEASQKGAQEKPRGLEVAEAPAAAQDVDGADGDRGAESFEFLGVPVKWFSTFDEVPQGEPFVLIAHEFFDALPIHQFQKTERGWCEKLVDVYEKPVVASANGTGEPRIGFRFILSPGPTAATTLALLPRLKWESDQNQEHAEMGLLAGESPSAQGLTKHKVPPSAALQANSGTPESAAAAGSTQDSGMVLTGRPETATATPVGGSLELVSESVTGGTLEPATGGTNTAEFAGSSSTVSRLKQVEVSPASVRVALDIAQRIAKDSGAALVVDYGEDGIVSDSLQAIRKHQFVPVLDRPGSADLSAHVDFAALRHAVNSSGVEAEGFGPITQSSFLGQLGINFRVEALMENATEEQAEALRLSYWRLVGDGEPPWDPEGAEEGAGQGASERAGQVEGEGAENTGGDGVAGRRKGEEGSEGGAGSGSKTVTGMGSQYKVLAIVKKGLGPPVCFS